MCPHSATPTPWSIDHRGYPHIIDAIVAAAPYASLVALRAASHSFRDRVDRLFVDKIYITPDTVTTGDGKHIPRAKWWDEPDLVACVRIVTVETRGRKWVTKNRDIPSGTGDSGDGGAASGAGDASSSTHQASPIPHMSPSWPCLRAVCHPWANASSLVRSKDMVAVRMIRHTGSRGDMSGSETRTVALSLRGNLRNSKRSPPKLYGITKLVINAVLEESPDTRLDLNRIHAGGATAIVVHFTGPREVNEASQAMDVRRSLRLGLDAIRTWARCDASENPSLTIVGADAALAHILPRQDAQVYWRSMLYYARLKLQDKEQVARFEASSRNISEDEYRDLVGDDVFRLETEVSGPRSE